MCICTFVFMYLYLWQGIPDVKVRGRSVLAGTRCKLLIWRKRRLTMVPPVHWCTTAPLCIAGAFWCRRRRRRPARGCIVCGSPAPTCPALLFSSALHFFSLLHCISPVHCIVLHYSYRLHWTPIVALHHGFALACL